VRYLERGDYFGELALMSNSSKRTLSVTAIEKVKCLAISRSSFIYQLY